MITKWAALALCASACAAPAPPPSAPSVEVRKPAPDAAPPASAPALPRVLAVVHADSKLVVYLDGQKLRSAGWFHALMAAGKLVPGADPLGDVRQRCGFDPVEALASFAAAGDVGPDGPTDVVAEADLTRPASDVLSCIARVAPASAASKIDGHDALALDGDRAVLVGADRVLALGSRDGLAGMDLAPARAAQALPPFAARALAAHRDATLIVAADLGSIRGIPVRSALLVMESDATHWRLATDLDADSADTARLLAAQLDISRLPTAAGAPLPGSHATAHGTHVMAELVVNGDAAEQATRIGALAAVTIYGVRRYLARAKQAEALSNVSEIAADLRAYVEALPAGKRLLPPSAPRTPSAVPRGVKAQSNPADWQRGTWRTIQFKMTTPEYYSYEIVTAKDRKSAVIRATGDLDGDGVEAHVTLRVAIDKRGLFQIVGNIEQDSPLE